MTNQEKGGKMLFTLLILLAFQIIMNLFVLLCSLECTVSFNTKT